MPYPHAGAIRPPGGGPDGPRKALAMICALAAAFMWSAELYALTIDEFRAIAIRNYGAAPLHLLELAYNVFLHIAVFVGTRAAVEIALTALVAAGAYRFAF